MKQEHINEIKAIVILSIGMILLASLVSFVPEDLPWYTGTPNVPAQNFIRITGAYLAGILLFVFGYSSYALVVILFFWSWNKFSSRDIDFSFSKFLSSLTLFAVLSSLFSMVGPQDSTARFQRAGVVGYVIADFLVRYIGRVGASIILITLAVLSMILIGEFLVAPMILLLAGKTRETVASVKEFLATHEFSMSGLKPSMDLSGFFKNTLAKKKAASASDEADEEDEEEEYEYEYEDEAADDEDEEYEYEEEDEAPEPKKPKKSKPRIKIAPSSQRSSAGQEEPLEVYGEYRIPPLDLLQDPPEISTSKVESELMTGAKLLEETLAQFSVSAKVVDIERGPAITRYELEPAPGVKIQKFTSLSDDIALAMKAAVVRIVAPIPGKNRIGIEVPNGASSTVYLKDVLSSDKFKKSKSKLTLSLGKDIGGAPIVADLASMPHMLIAGTTGAGKTVCVNGIIMSMLLNASPEHVKFVMVDPKMVELAQYNDIPHLLCPTVTDSKKAAGVLNWVVGEMESRYKKLAKAKVRNIKGYNAIEGNSMPFIVVIIDELADLMQVSAKAVESSITRIAQLSRAVGIHLILATQRPSVDVITGVIKANFPARISFKVASKVDSRTVLDFNGAETLLGRGDMLFIKPGDAKPTRGQCSYVDDEEINKVIQFIKDQQEPSYNDSIMKHQESTAKGVDGPKDEYYDEAVRLVIETNQASVSILQRRMRLGYTRAARLIDTMEQDGIVGPYCGSKPREIMVDREKWLLENMEGEQEE
jgi:S-DNA-T family DNA segregation ATPase FtsK/SpoIIIE